MRIGLGQLRLSPSEFRLMTLREFINAVEGFEELRVADMEAEWTRTHWLGWVTSRSMGATKAQSLEQFVRKRQSVEKSDVDNTPIKDRKDFSDEAKKIFASDQLPRTLEEFKERQKLKKKGFIATIEDIKQHTKVIINE